MALWLKVVSVAYIVRLTYDQFNRNAAIIRLNSLVAWSGKGAKPA
ncbi:hypothetical protein [Spirosoma horti]